MELKLKSVRLKFLLPSLAFLALGLAVVIAGFGMGSAPNTRTVFVAKQSIAEGETISPTMLTTTTLPLGELGNFYLTKLTGTESAAHAIVKGELISKQLVSHETAQRTPIRINNLPQISKAISVGDYVDVWATAVSQLDEGDPHPVAFNAIVVAIETNSAMSQVTTSVELRIGTEYLETLLAAVDSNYKISLILHETLSDVQ